MKRLSLSPAATAGFTRKAGAALLACTLAAGLLGPGCAAPDPERDGPAAGNQAASAEDTDPLDIVTLVTNDASLRHFPEYLEEVRKATGLDVRVVTAPDNPNDRVAKFHTILSSGSSSEDILNINDEMLSQFKALGYLTPLERLVMTPEVQEQLYMEYVSQLAMEDGHIYTVPQHAEVLALWVDCARLEAAGLEEINTAEDYREFLEACAQQGVYGYGGSWEKTYAYNEICTFVSLFGGDYLDWTNPRSREGVEYLYNLAHSGYTPIDQVSQQYDSMINKFIAGEYGSVFMWNTFTQQLLDSGRYGPEDIRMYPIPRFEESTVYMASWHYVLNQACADREPAVRLLEYFASKEGQLADARILKRYPARRDALYDRSLEGLEGLEDLKYYLESYEIQARPMSADTMPFIEGMGDLFQKYVFDEITLDQYCEMAQELVDQYM